MLFPLSTKYYPHTYTHKLLYIYIIQHTKLATQRTCTKSKKTLTRDICQHAFSQHVINSWNSLHVEVVSATSVNHLKQLLDMHHAHTKPTTQIC